MNKTKTRAHWDVELQFSLRVRSAYCILTTSRNLQQLWQQEAFDDDNDKLKDRVLKEWSTWLQVNLKPNDSDSVGLKDLRLRSPVNCWKELFEIRDCKTLWDSIRRHNLLLSHSLRSCCCHTTLSLMQLYVVTMELKLNFTIAGPVGLLAALYVGTSQLYLSWRNYHI